MSTESTKELGTREKSSQMLFAQATECEPSVGHLFVTPGFRLFSGCCGTRSTRLFEIIYTRVALKQPRTMAWKQTALRWIFQRCRFAVGDELPLYATNYADSAGFSFDITCACIFAKMMFFVKSQIWRLFYSIMRRYKPLILLYNTQVWGGYRQNAMYAGKNSVLSSSFKFLGWIT